MRPTSAAPFDNVNQFAADNRAARLPTEPEPRARTARGSGSVGGVAARSAWPRFRGGFNGCEFVVLTVPVRTPRQPSRQRPGMRVAARSMPR